MLDVGAKRPKNTGAGDPVAAGRTDRPHQAGSVVGADRPGPEAREQFQLVLASDPHNQHAHQSLAMLDQLAIDSGARR